MCRSSHYLGTMFATFGMGILLHVLAFYYQLGTSFPASYWAHDARIIKTHLLSSGNERKLVIIGGSNAYFGFSSGLIETATGLRVVNTSLHFDWPLDFFFSDVKPWLNPGDIVLLTLEYEYYQRETPFTNQFVSDMMSLEPQYFWNLNWRQRVEFFISVPPRRIAGGVLARLFHYSAGVSLAPHELLTIWSTQPERINSGGYSIRFLDQHGDFVSTFGTPFPWAPIYPLQRPFIHHPYPWSVLTAFADWCHVHGVAVYVAWPPTAQDPVLDFDSPQVQRHVEALTANLRLAGIPTLGQPRDFQFRRSLFSDSQYHLIPEGRVERTTRLVPYIQAILRSDSLQEPAR
jgi:hypothetical protein